MEVTAFLMANPEDGDLVESEVKEEEVDERVWISVLLKAEEEDDRRSSEEVRVELSDGASFLLINEEDAGGA
jgi:hypothetical protein